MFGKSRKKGHKKNQCRESSKLWQWIKSRMTLEGLYDVSKIDTDLSLVPDESYSTRLMSKSLFDYSAYIISALDLKARKLQEQVDAIDASDMCFDLININTYLHQITVCMQKNKHNINLFENRYALFCNDESQLTRLEVQNAIQASTSLVKTCQDLLGLLDSVELIDLNNHRLLNYVKTMEMETTHFVTALEAILSLCSHMKVLDFETSEDEIFIESSSKSVLEHATLSQSSCDLAHRIQKVENPANQYALATLLEEITILQNSYIASKRSQIKHSLVKLKGHTESLVDAYVDNARSGEIIILWLSVFSEFDKIRFHTNRQTRAAQKLFERVRMATQNVRKAFYATKYGWHHLQERQKQSN